MKIYADRPLRFTLQFLSDAFAIVWIWLWVRAGQSLHATLMTLTRPGELMEESGGGLTSHMNEAAEVAGGVPLVGEQLAVPFQSMGEAGDSLSEAGTRFQESVTEMALLLSVLTAVLPVMMILVLWLPLRARWIRQASGARRLRRMSPEASSELLALRALASAPVRALTKVHGDPVDAWRRGDPEAVDRLAALELRRLGLRR
ncbi:hypothetical protein [Nocardiopsis ansamitocini]|uniref:Transmembrane protein n=1 Tax=Nocardiopsis ansamitocini TaxID=1670832 RepID=A0A9W6UGZ3_9ACTN|nr:hypothetical protein [Nocardiopsis ansamitocini]GLU46187.1 hypothetical protein Nans01_05380 [Nocardiopsis ansamitocini]